MHVSNGGVGINRQIPRLSVTTKINGEFFGSSRGDFILQWMRALSARLRDVRVASGDWSRVLGESVIVQSGVAGIFLDPPYTLGAMDYAVGGVGGALADEVRAWCIANGARAELRIVLCGHAGEHDALIAHGWHTRSWRARKGYAKGVGDQKPLSATETLWCSPSCVAEVVAQADLFAA